MTRTSFQLCVCLLLGGADLRAEPAVIGLARAYLGPDSTLDGIQSIHFTGSLERVNPDLPGKPPARASLDMVFVKPSRQRQTMHIGNLTEITVLDGYDAWDRVHDNANPPKFRMKWLSAAEIKSLRANTWENLYFYRGMGEGGSVEDKGPATVDGIVCERVDFIHGPGIDFERYFDRDTGRLVASIRDGETIRERGEIRVDGIRFPKSIVSTKKTASGKDLVTTVQFDSITLNEPIVSDAFAVPAAPAVANPPATAPATTSAK